MNIKRHWDQSCSTLNVPQKIADEYWKIINLRYGESQRYYHTIAHIEDMFRHFEDVYGNLEQPAIVAMAIFFHDVIYEPKEKDNEERRIDLYKRFVAAISVIYEPKEKDNEERSADLYKRFVDAINSDSTQNNTTCPQIAGQPVVDWVLATKAHKTDVHTTPEMYGESDLYYLLDMDMAILGTTPQEYRDYADKIRKEYCHYSKEAYRQGRAKVLQSFLKIPNIYATKVFRDKYEAQARSNIQDEIQRLLKE